MGAFALLVTGLGSGRLRLDALNKLLADAIALTGALFALLLAATTFTMMLRLLGTADLVGRIVAAIPGGEITAVAVVLALIGLSAFVLDAFEIIFVIVPIVIPPLLIRVADARWVAVLVLLTLQASFLLPPFGYALMMVRGVLKEPVAFRALLKALAPFLAAQWLLLAGGAGFPATHPHRTVGGGLDAPAGRADVGRGVQQAPAGDDPDSGAAGSREITERK